MALRKCLVPLVLLVSACPAMADEPTDNGTNPTKFSSNVDLRFEHLALGGGASSGSLKLSYTMPLGANKDYSLQFKLPVNGYAGIGDGGYGIGDASLKLAHVFGVTPQRGMVVQGELVFDTASRPVLGTGKQVLKGTFIYAKFLEGGAIFAPAIVQSNSLGGDGARSDINNTTLDFYYVPKLSDPRNLITLDPSLTFDWETNREFAGLAVTFGRVIGPMFGGNGIVSVKPSILAGNERPADWGIELGFKVIGF